MYKASNLESTEQKVLFEWASYIPELEWMYAVPNGGSRNVKEAANLKRQGVKAGVSDVVIPVPKGKYHGAYLELKVGRNKPSEKQKAFLRHVIEQGYCGVVCYGFEEARNFISRYLRGENLDEMCVNSISEKKSRRK